MKLKILSALCLLAFSGGAWAGPKHYEAFGPSIPMENKVTRETQEAADRQRQSARYITYSTYSGTEFYEWDISHGISTRNRFIVVRDSNAWTMDEFVWSGKFCEWRGCHEWDEFYSHSFPYPEKFDKCSVCGKRRSRKKVKRTIEVEEFER